MTETIYVTAGDRVVRVEFTYGAVYRELPFKDYFMDDDDLVNILADCECISHVVVMCNAREKHGYAWACLYTDDGYMMQQAFVRLGGILGGFKVAWAKEGF